MFFADQKKFVVGKEEKRKEREVQEVAEVSPGGEMSSWSTISLEQLPKPGWHFGQGCEPLK